MRIELGDGTAAEMARPSDGVDVTSGLVLCPDIGGLRPLFDELAQRLADENGWVVVVPEPFPGQEGLDLAARMAAVGSLDEEVQLERIEMAADATGMAIVNVLGFCMGGMLALKAAGLGRFERAVAFYGMIRMPENWRSASQTDAIDYVTRPGASPVLAIVGTADSFVPMSDVADLQQTSAEVVVYDGAEHGFVHDASRPAHRPDDAADAWSRAIAFLEG
jgi:carboxymethylenebutenolidase